MNKVYKLIWSKVRNCYVAVAEIAKSHTKAPKSGVVGAVSLENKVCMDLNRGFVAGVFANGRTLMPGRNNDSFKITVAAIVKNEAENVPTWVQAARSCADEIVVVDTGSTDGTVERFADYGIKCFHYDWHDDFASAKNYMISLCHGDWIVLLDGDEWFREGCDVRKAIAKHHANPITKAIIADWICLDKDRGNAVMFSGGAVRAFRNQPDVRYFRKVHENLTINYENFAFEPDFKMYHTGYSGSVNRSKHERNLRIMRTMFDFDNGKVEYPTDWRYIEDTYAGLGQFDKALWAADKMISYGVQEYSAAAWITKFNVLFAMKTPLVEMKKQFEYCFQTVPSVSGFRFLATIYYIRNGLVDKGLTEYIEGLRMLMGPQDRVAMEHTFWRMYLPEASALASTVYLQNKQLEAALYACKVCEQYCGQTDWTNRALADVRRVMNQTEEGLLGNITERVLPVLQFGKKAVLATAIASSLTIGMVGISNPVFAACCNLNGVTTNKTTGANSTVTGGQCNTASGCFSSVSGGSCNTASNCNSSVSGGYGNIASCCFSSVSGGMSNKASGEVSSVSGGSGNTASGNYSSVSGGTCNTARANYSSVSGGWCNTAYNWGSWVAGGCNGVAYACLSSAIGGGIAGVSTCLNIGVGSVAIGKNATTTRDYEVAIGSSDAPVKIGGNLTVTGTQTVTDGTNTKSWTDIIKGYSLPAATSSALGGVKIGSNITNSNGTISLTKANVTAALGYTPPTADTDTHYTTHLYAGSGTAANAATTNGNTKIALADDSTVRNTLTIKGAGKTTVTSDANGVITITSTDANTTYSAFTGATSSAAGTAGLVKAPAAGDQNKFLRGDGTWAVDNDTKYTNMSASELNTGTATTARSISAKVISDYVTGKVSAETTARADADTALGTRIDNAITAYESADIGLSNRIGSLSADGNYIKKSATNNVSANLTVLDTQLKTTTTALGTETTNRTNADTALSNRIGSVASDGTFIKKSATNDVATNLTALDTAAKNAIKGLSVNGTTITYTKGDGTTGTITTQDNNTTYANMTASELETGTATAARSISAKVLGDYVTGKVSAETTARTTAINSEASTRQSEDTALSNRIGSLSADGNYIKKSATNNVSANLTALDTQLKNTASAVGTETTNRTNADTALGNRIGTLSADGNYIKKSDTKNVSENLSLLDAQVKANATAVSNEITNRMTAITNEASARSSADTALGTRIDNAITAYESADTGLSNRIGTLSANGNYITIANDVLTNVKALDTKIGSAASANGTYVKTANTVNANIKALDTQLKTTTDNLVTEVTNRTTAVTNEATARVDADTALGTRIDNVTSAYQTADTGLSNRIGMLSADGHYIKKSSTKDIAENLQILDEQLSTISSTASSNVNTLTEADTALSNRIGSLDDDGYYIKKSATNDVVANLSVLDSQLKLTDESTLKYDGDSHELATLGGTNGTKLTNLKQGTLSASSKDAVTGAQLYATNQSIAGFATDITRNKNNIRDLNSSVSSALDAVSSASTLVDTINGLKADASLNNLTAAGRQVIATAAANAVQEYMANNSNSLNMSMSPLSVGRGLSSSGTLNVTDAGNGSLHVGEGSYVNGTSSIAIGVGNQVNANNSGAFGDPSIINADESYVLGNDDTINEGATGSFLVGNDSVSDAKGGLSLGSNNKLESSAEDSVLLGNNTSASGRNSVALGSGSVAEQDDAISVGNSTLKRRIMNVADGDVSEGSTDVVTGGQLYVTNEKVKTNEEAIAKKAETDASNIDVDAWIEKLGNGNVAEGDNGLVTGGTVYDAIQDVKSSSLIESDGEVMSVGKHDTSTVIDVSNALGDGRVITGVITDPKDPYSAANVGYVNEIGENIVNAVNRNFEKVDTKINRVGANAAAMASLTPASFEGDEKWSFAASVGHYKGETAGAVGAFYKPVENVMMNVRGSFGNDESMVGAGVAIALNKGDIPGVTKRQLAKEVISLKKEREEDRARIAQLEAAVQALLKEKNSDSSK